MIIAKITDKERIINLLANAFADNLSVKYIIQKDDKRLEHIKALMDYSFKVCNRFGKVFLSNDRRACALVLYPHHKKTTLLSVWLDIKLIFTAIGINNIKKALEREAKINAKQTNVPMAYLWFIGVDLHHQQSGIGSTLLKEVIADAKQQSLPVYLETSTKRNLPWYKKYGFVEYDQLNLGYTLHFLKYSPAS